MQAAGAEAAWLSEDPAMNLSVGLAGPWCHRGLHLSRGDQGTAPLSPHSGVTVLSHPSKLRCAVSEIAATIGHWSGWFKSPDDPNFYFFI